MPGLLTVVLATSNEGKLLELRTLFGDLPLQLLGLNAVAGGEPSVVEYGATLQENAIIKARAACAATGLYALADDSGLEVEALGGRPGVHSARFAHERATDAENNAALLRELEEVEDEGRQARFRCVLALASPWDPEHIELAEGTCEGLIARAPRGSGGFGYDPLFIVPELGGRAMAEMSDDEKNEVSHRARAARAMRATLEKMLDARIVEVERCSRV
jgi:XTP/dITP diphosphohydrolase